MPPAGVTDHSARIEGFLRRRQNRRSLRHLGFGLLILALAIPVSILYFLFICVAYQMVAGGAAGEYTLWASLAIFLLTFSHYLKTRDKDALADISYSTGTTSDKVVHLQLCLTGHGAIAGSTVNPLAPNTIHGMAKLVASIFCIVPVLTFAAFGQLSQVLRVRRMAFADAARVLAFLATRPQRVPYGAIVQEVPGLDPPRAFADLAKIDGVLFLTTTPAGLSLTDRLRAELAHLRSADHN